MNRLTKKEVLLSLKKIGEKDEKIPFFSKALIKKMASSNVLPVNRISAHSHQTHIAITSEEMKVFPFIASTEYLKNLTKEKIYQPLSGFVRNYFDFSDDYFKSINFTCYVRKGNQDSQIQIGKFNLDDENFMKYRKKIKEKDYMIVLNNGDDYYFYRGEKELQIKTGVFF